MTIKSERVGKMDFSIRVANRNILIHSVYQNLYNICEPYRIEEYTEPDIEIRTDEDMINAEVERIRISPGQALDLSGVERMLVLRLITEAILSFDTLLMHGAVVAIGNEGYMFTANSGVGKSTHIQSWLNKCKDAYVVNGDKPFVILRRDNGEPLVCGSPWAGKENLQSNVIVPLKAIVLLERADENHMERISFVEAFPALLAQVFHPNSKEKMKKTLQLMRRFYPTTSFWRFQCNNFKEDCFDVAYNALVKNRAGLIKEE